MSKPITIRRGSVSLTLFPCRNGRYLRHEFRYTDCNGRRHHVKISNLQQARREAERIAADLARGHHHAELSLADLASFRAAIVNLYGCGKTLELATAEYADCQRKLIQAKSDASLAEAVKFYLVHRPAAGDLTAATRAVVENFLVELRARGMSHRHQEDLRDRLRRFARDNPGPIGEQTAATVQTWSLCLQVAPRTRNNYLAAVQTLFADASLVTHPHAAGIQIIKTSKLAKVPKLIWLVAEMRLLLTTALRFDESLIPVLVLGGFGKLRASEAAATRAADLRLDDRQMVLRDGGKTDGRLIPLPDNCCEWLTRYAPKDGRMWSLTIGAMNAHLRRLAARCSLKWRSNALRKSANTYAIALDPDYERTSAAAGNSPKMLRDHYVDPSKATKADAAAWFSLLPSPTPRIIVPMEQSA